MGFVGMYMGILGLEFGFVGMVEVIYMDQLEDIYTKS